RGARNSRSENQHEHERTGSLHLCLRFVYPFRPQSRGDRDMSHAILERRVSVLTAVLGITSGSLAIFGQVKTNVPAPVAGARPAIVERITIHGTALEGNLEGDAVDRDA